jgi:hypothetical protein
MLDGMNTERRRLLDAVKESVQAEKVQPDFFPKDVKAVRSDLRNQAAALKEKANENYGLTWHPAMGRRAEYAFDHDPLLGAYPEIARGVIVRRGANGQPGVRGSFDYDSKSLDIYGAATDPLSVGLHELQHAVQKQEGTAGGGNPWQFEPTPVPGTAVDTSAIDDLIRSVGFKRPDDTIDARSYLNALFDQVKSHPSSTPDAMLRIADEMKRIDKLSLSPMEQYRRLAGETEARTVQARQNLNADERRARPPWLDYDVPEANQIVRSGSGEGAMMSADVPRAVDPLGYYSPTLEAALKLAQNKGTPEQMLAQLKKAGAKDSEIEVSGLKKMFDGKKAVTKDEIVKALEEGKVGLNEVRYGGSEAENRIELVGRPWDDGDGVQAQTIMFNDVEYTAYYDRDAGNAWAVTPDGQTIPGTGRMNNQDWDNAHEAIQAHGSRSGIPDDAAGAARFADYSLDPQNPTYREVVLHLPDKLDDLQARKDALMSEVRTKPGEARLQEINNELFAINQEANARKANRFQSGHFDEPNIVGHMMVSETRLPGDPKSRVLTLDQVQSDWGQKIRDGGVRDDAKIAELKAKLDEAAAIEDRIVQEFQAAAPEGDRIKSYVPDARDRLSQMSATGDPVGQAWRRAWNDRNLFAAELKTWQAATPGHPLVNTTDQWLNTTLRRAIRMAAEEGQDYIAIPSGNTVLGYNPGQEKGMLGFYGGLPEEMGDVMSSLKSAASKSPNEPVINTLSPQTIDALAEAGILDKKKIEGISTARVLKNAESRFQGIVPKNLGALLQKLDKNTPPPQVIDTLDSPSGATGLGQGFTLYRITPEAKKAAKEGGQPLFRWGGRVT